MHAALAPVTGAAACLAVAGALLPVLGQTAPSRDSLRPPSAFAGISDPRARSVALFEEAGKVITHPRCVNCHPAGDRPKQSDRGQPHQPMVVRGADGHGAPGLNCNTCHHAANYDPAKVPGHPQWHLAPLAMAWEGRSLGQICEQIKDPARNGGKDMQALLHHMSDDTLVGWAWSPGADRTRAPGTQAEFGALLRAWADLGGVCPAS